MTRHSADDARALVLIEQERLVIERAPDADLAVGLRAAQYLGIPMASIAATSGLTRTRAYALLERTDAGPHKVPPPLLNHLVASALRDDAPIGSLGHSAELRVDVRAMRETLAWLRQRGVAELLARTGDEAGRITEEFWIPGPSHEAWIQSELKALRWVHADRWAIYVRIPDDISVAVGEAAHRLAPALSDVIRTGNSSVITWDEFAMAIVADDSREALRGAYDLWTSVCEQIGELAPFDVRQVLPPIRR
ncbi:MAG TPA: hypothetical protein VFY45_06030 [Baekduia sp.]|nr:hypothetical protein [Baekduia sp.]